MTATAPTGSTASSSPPATSTRASASTRCHSAWPPRAATRPTSPARRDERSRTTCRPRSPAPRSRRRPHPSDTASRVGILEQSVLSGYAAGLTPRGSPPNQNLAAQLAGYYTGGYFAAQPQPGDPDARSTNFAVFGALALNRLGAPRFLHRPHGGRRPGQPAHRRRVGLPVAATDADRSGRQQRGPDRRRAGGAVRVGGRPERRRRARRRRLPAAQADRLGRRGGHRGRLRDRLRAPTPTPRAGRSPA